MADEARRAPGSPIQSVTFRDTASQSDPPPSVAETIAAADELIALVRGLPAHGGGQGDSAGLVMHGAYLKGFGRFVSIRELARRGAGGDASVLLRAMLSLVARAAWVNAPAATDEREARFMSYRRRDLEDGLRMLNEGEQAGIEFERETREAEAAMKVELDELRKQGVPSLPFDRQLLGAVHMQSYYARIYGPASEHVHFSLTTAVRDLRGVAEARIEEPQWELADQVLQLAFIVFGRLLEISEPSVRHGLETEAARIARDRLGL